MTRAERPPGPERDDPSWAVPAPLKVAVAVTVLEAVVFLGYAVSLLPNLRGNRPEVGLTALAFFVLWSALLGVGAWQLWRLHSWARAPVVLAQLIHVMVGVSFWGGGTTWVAVLMIAVAAAVLGTVLHPRSIAALES